MKTSTLILIITYAILLALCLAQRSCIVHLTDALNAKCPCDSVKIDPNNPVHNIDTLPLYEPEMSNVLEGGKIPQGGETVKTTHPVKSAGSTDLTFAIEDGTYQPIDPLVVYDGNQQINYLHDVQKIKYGTITIDDSLQNNRVKNRRLSYDMQLPTRVEYIRTDPKRPPPVRLYVGFQVQGMKGDPLSACGPSMAVQTRGGVLYEATTLITRSQLIYQAGLKIPLNH